MKTNLFRMSRRCICSVRRSALLFIMLVGSLFFSNETFGQITFVNSQSATKTGNTALNINKPIGLAVGDVMFASIVQSDNSSGLDDAASAGWTEVTGNYVFDQTGNRCRGTLLYKIAVAGDVAAVSFPFTLDSDVSGTAGVISAFRGVDTTGGVNQSGTANSGPFDLDPGTIGQSSSSSTLAATAISTGTVNSAVIMFSFLGDNVSQSAWDTATSPNLVEIFDVAYDVPSVSTDNAIGASWGTKAATGTTGAGSVNLSGSTRGGAVLIALRQATSISTGTIAGAPFCAGNNVSVPYTITGTFASNNTFTAQLSNSAGSFATPTTIGSVANTNTAGSISATIPAGQASGSGYRIRVIANQSPKNGSDNGVDIQINAPATAVAGTPVSACITGGAVNITSGSSATNNLGVTWTSNGLGTISNPNSLTTATYTPDPSDGPTVTLTLTATGVAPCADAVSNKTLTINQVPTASAGGSATICDNATAVVSGASSSNGTIAWTENGSGSITAGANTLTPTYTAAAGDAGNAVTLTMTVSNGSCADAVATYTVNVVGSATAAAGSGFSTCANSGAVNITAGSSASNNTGVQWSTSGDGTFSDADSLTLAIYTPGANDISNGSVTLTLTAFGNSPCGNVTSNKTLTINPLPVVVNTVICTGDTGFLTSSTNCPEEASVNIPATFAGSGATAGAGVAWGSPGNVTTNNNSSASVSGNGTAFSQALQATNFGFAIPSTAVIKGIVVTIGRNRSGGITGEIRDNSLRLMEAGVAVGTDNAATGTNWPTSEGVATYGASNNTWGNSWTAADINASNFGVALIVTNTNTVTFLGTRTANVDYVQVSVTYAVPGSLDWYTVSSGGASIGSGSSFNPVGVPNSGLADTNTPGTTTYYVECSTLPGCRSAVDFVINARPVVTFSGLAADYCAGSSSVTLTGNHVGGTFTGAGITDNGNGTASFNPTTAGIGTHNITYTYNDGTCPNSDMQSVTIIPNVTYYADTDSDTYGDLNAPLVTCYAPPAGYVLDSTDCDDTDASMHTTFAFYVDADGDGFGTGSLTLVCAVDVDTPPAGYALNNTDCNDADNTMNASFDFFVDADGDGFGSATIQNVCAVDANTPPAGYALVGTDCNDNDNTMNAEFAFYADGDGDGYGVGSLMNVCAVDANTPPAGYSLVNTDCNDTIAAINPGQAEILYNGIDDNCDGQLDEGFQLLSQVLNAQCATTLTTMSSLIGCVSFSAPVTGYRFKVVNMTTLAEQTIDKNVPHFQLTQLATFDYATTYSISIELQRNGVWLGYYGPSCLVSSPAVLDTNGAAQVTPSQCGITLPSMSTLIATTSLPNVTAYRFRVTNMTDPTAPNQVQLLDRSLHWFALTMLTTHTYGTTYLIEVAVKTNGAFSGFGSPCQVSTPVVPTLTQCDAVIATPGSLITTTSLNRATSYRFEVTDMTTFVTTTVDRSQHWFTFNHIPGYTPNGPFSVRVAVMSSGVWSLLGEACMITAPGVLRAAIKGEEDTQPQIDFRVVSYPNPYTESFALDVDLPTAEPVEVKVYDMLGKMVEIRTFEAEQAEMQQFGNALAAGVYNVIVTQGENVKTLRVVKR